MIRGETIIERVGSLGCCSCGGFGSCGICTYPVWSRCGYSRNFGGGGVGLTRFGSRRCSTRPASCGGSCT